MKISLRSIRCFFVLLFVFLFSSISTYAIENNEYKFTDVNPEKVWKVKFNKVVDGEYLKKVQAKLMDERGIDLYLQMSLGDDDKTVLIKPPSGGYEEDCSYEINIPAGLRAKNGETLKKISTIKFTVGDNSKIIRYVDYNMTVEEFAINQQNNERMIIYGGNGIWSTPTLDEVKYYIDPENFMDEYGIYQFLVLNYVEGMTVDEVNEILRGKGILEGRGLLC